MSEPMAESPFANDYAEAQQPGGTTSYVRALLDLLGDRDPLAVVEATPAALDRATAGVDEAKLRQPEREGKWSIAEVVAHLADSELVWGYRLRRVLAEERPQIIGYDQDLWANRLRYRDAQLADSLATFSALRATNLRLVRATSAEDMQRVGVHTERGEESVAHMLKLYAAHDLVHLRQIERIKAAVTATG
ncbi:MAG TPA: DinB family protein [Thermoanaerobaculia bacterium]|jgi:uncharacterized damage-inducible protein DinB|nr:DinB family protein [Thermoanaerobaculia bacterium]